MKLTDHPSHWNWKIRFEFHCHFENSVFITWHSDRPGVTFQQDFRVSINGVFVLTFSTFYFKFDLKDTFQKIFMWRGDWLSCTITLLNLCICWQTCFYQQTAHHCVLDSWQLYFTLRVYFAVLPFVGSYAHIHPFSSILSSIADYHSLGSQTGLSQHLSLEFIPLERPRIRPGTIYMLSICWTTKPCPLLSF